MRETGDDRGVGGETCCVKLFSGVSTYVWWLSVVTHARSGTYSEDAHRR